MNEAQFIVGQKYVMRPGIATKKKKWRLWNEKANCFFDVKSLRNDIWIALSDTKLLNMRLNVYGNFFRSGSDIFIIHTMDYNKYWAQLNE